jgi:hypothetical protein
MKAIGISGSSGVGRAAWMERATAGSSHTPPVPPMPNLLSAFDLVDARPGVNCQVQDGAHFEQFQEQHV